MKSRLGKIWRWIDDRSGISEALKPLLNHLVPPGAKWSYVFGSATLFCLLLQVVTGIGLAMLYEPSSASAFRSLQYIDKQVFLGKWLRGIHYFGASGMILMVGIHMIRVYITAAFKYPREINWISGVVLLLLTTAMGFTGQLLRWDDNGVWSAVVAAEQLGRIPLLGKPIAHILIGGDTINNHSLSRFFSYHVFVFPALIFMFVGFHLYLVIRNGISEPPKIGRLIDPKTYRAWYQDMLKRKGLPFWPYAAWRDVVFSVGCILVIMSLAYFFGPPPLLKPPNPSIVHVTPKPDWYLLWIYALFALMPASIESYAIVLIPPLVIFALFALPFLSNKGERHAIRRPWAIVGVVLVVTTVGCLLIVGFKAPWSPKFDAKELPPSVVHSTDSNVVAGAHLFFLKKCIDCHQVGTFGGQTGPDLTLIGRRLNTTELNIRIINGGTKMPSYGQSLSQDELAKLVAFLRSRQ